MATERIKLFEADIDVDGIIKKSVELKDETVKLRQDLKVLKITVGENNEEYIKTEARLKKVSAEYRVNQKQVSNLAKSSKDFLTVEEKLNTSLQKEVKTINEAKKNNKELREIRNELNAETVEGAEAIAEINKKLDENTDFIKENVSAYEQQKMAIGDYKNQIIEAYDEMNILNGGISGFISRAQDAGGAGNLVTNAVKGMTQGVIGLTKATLGFIATPIGALLAVLVGAFLLVKNAMNRSEEATAKINKIFAIFSGIINKVLSALEPLGEFLIDGLVVGFELAGKAADRAIGLISSGLKFLGFDKAAQSVAEWHGELKEGVKEAQELAMAELELEKAQRKARLTQLEYQKDAEKLRQIRDDESLSIQERIQANDELGAVLKQQLDEELAIAQQALIVANLRIKAEGQTKEALDAQADALTEIADIQERITGQESEQLVNRVALQKEAVDKAKEFADKAIAQQRAELELYIANQGVKAKTLEKQLEIAEETYKREADILAAELKNRNITQTEYDAQLLELKNDLLRQQAEASVENAQRELDIYIQNNQSKLDADLYFSEESLRIEQERLNGLAEKHKEFEATRLAEGLITQQQYNDAINAINEENRLALEDSQKQREEAQKQKDLIDLENRRIVNEERIAFDLEFQLQELEARRLQELEAAEKTGADLSLIEQKYAQQRKQIEQAVTDNKLSLASQSLSNVITIVGKESALGKTAAIAQTTIDTYQSATAAYKAMAGIPVVGPALGAVAAAAAVVSGLQNVAKITKAKPPRAERGAVFDIGGKRHSQGGTMFYGEDGTRFEAEKDEKLFVLNRRASANLAPLLSDVNQMYGGVSLSKSSSYLATGGSVLRSSVSSQGIDYNKVAEQMAQGVREGSLEGTRQGAMEGASKGTYSGIVDREDFNEIERAASF